MSLSARFGLILMLGAMFGFTGGCNSEPKPLSPDDAVEQGKLNMMRELGEMLVLYKGDHNKPPKSAADLAKFEAGFQIGYLRVKEGEIVLLWGAPIQEGASETILAYEKAVPEVGGYVLMQDGTTVKKVTADEFKAASKAPGTASAGKAAK